MGNEIQNPFDLSKHMDTQRSVGHVTEQGQGKECFAQGKLECEGERA